MNPQVTPIPRHAVPLDQRAPDNALVAELSTGEVITESGTVAEVVQIRCTNLKGLEGYHLRYWNAAGQVGQESSTGGGTGGNGSVSGSGRAGRLGGDARSKKRLKAHIFVHREVRYDDLARKRAFCSEEREGCRCDNLLVLSPALANSHAPGNGKPVASRVESTRAGGAVSYHSHPSRASELDGGGDENGRAVRGEIEEDDDQDDDK
ncbi:hypothetical protein BDD12DRAFT_881606 [Trichophaea hybrida]|nr:hypothetical protein BDD12DRAFT_881606 [Trichophaea hybrida]